MTSSVLNALKKSSFLNMPKSFYPILLIEFWERFGFYGLQSVAVLFFIKKIHLSDSNASTLFASFSAILYGLLVIGGYLGDKILGLRRTYLLGIIFLIIGYGMFGFINSIPMVYWAMGVILVGNIFFKTNAGNYVSRCFKINDPRLDSAFTYFYMSINLGSFCSTILIPFIAEKFSDSLGISTCGVGMFIALCIFIIFKKSFTLNDNEIGQNNASKLLLVLITSILGIIASYFLGLLLSSPLVTNIFFILSIIIFVLIFFILRAKLKTFERSGMSLVFLMILQAIIFYILYIQVATSLTLFAKNNVTQFIFGIKIPAGVTQAFNPLYIFLLSPILANIYMYSERKGTPISIPSKFALGILVCSFAYLLLAGSCYMANYYSQVPMIWLFLGYGLYSLGELLISAIGLSMVSKLIPKRLGGFAQAAWFMASAIGLKLGGIIASFSSRTIKSTHQNSIDSLNQYKEVFFLIGVSTLILAIIFFIFAPKLTCAINNILKEKALAEKI